MFPWSTEVFQVFISLTSPIPNPPNHKCKTFQTRLEHTGFYGRRSDTACLPNCSITKKQKKNHTNIHMYASFVGHAYKALPSQVPEATSTLFGCRADPCLPEKLQLTQVFVSSNTASHVITFCWSHPNTSKLATSKLRMRLCMVRNTDCAFLWVMLSSEMKQLFQRRITSSLALYPYSSRCPSNYFTASLPQKMPFKNKLLFSDSSLLSHSDTRWQQSWLCFALTGAMQLLLSVRPPPPWERWLLSSTHRISPEGKDPQG